MESKLIDEQHAYRKNRSCHSALSTFSHYVYDNIDRRKGRVGAVMIDMKSAFSVIPHDKLIDKLMYKFNLEPHYVKIFSENLAFRRFKFKNGKKYFINEAGVGQGSALGNLTFSLYLNDIKSAIDLPFICYADDLIIYTNGCAFLHNF